ncbi:MAG: OmpA family protein [Gammaproteobacteria bacterium]
MRVTIRVFLAACLSTLCFLATPAYSWWGPFPPPPPPPRVGGYPPPPPPPPSAWQQDNRQAADQARQLQALRASLQQVQKKNAVLQKEIEYQQSMLVDLKKLQASQQESLNRGAGNTDAIKAQLDSVKAVNQQLQGKLTSQVSELQVLAEKAAAVDVAENALAQARKEIAMLEENLAGVGADAEKINQLYLGLKDSTATSGQEFEKVRASMASCESHVQEMSAEKDTALSSLKKELSALKAHEAELLVRLQEKEQSNVASAEKMTALQAEYEGLNAEMADKMSAFGGLESQFNELTSAYETAKLSDGKLVGLTQELATLRTNFDETKGQLDTVVAEKNEKESQWAEKHQAFTALQQQVMTIREDAGVKTQALTVLQEKYTTLESEYGAAKEAAGQMGELQGLYESLQAESVAKDETISALTADRASLNTNIQGLMAQETEWKTKVQTRESMQHEMEAIKAEGLQKAAALAALMAETGQRTDTVDKLSAENEQLLEELTSLRTEAEQKAATLGKFSTDAEQHAQTLEALRADADEKTATLNQVSQDIEQKNEMLSSLQAEFDGFKKECATVQEEVAQGKEIAAELESLKMECTAKDDRLSVLATERDALMAFKTDTDNDGVVDADDKCPETSQGDAVDGVGCMLDGDADGVSDAADLCPESESGQSVDDVGCVPGASIVLQGVNFKYSSADFMAEALPVLNDVAETLNKHPNVRVEVAGYTDNTGPAEVNLQLSQLRADAVWNYLKDAGIDPSRLTSSGYGEANPVSDNGTAEGRYRNRRVELHILSE